MGWEHRLEGHFRDKMTEGKDRNIAKERREVIVALIGVPREGPGIRECTLWIWSI